MDKTIFMPLLLGGYLTIMGIVGIVLGYFIGGLRGAIRMVTGFPARLFGLAYLIFGTPILAYAIGKAWFPESAWFQPINAFVNNWDEGQTGLYALGWAIALLILHIISFAVAESQY